MLPAESRSAELLSLARRLKELVFLFQSLYFYLEHLDSRLQSWSQFMTPALARFVRQQGRATLLEQELEASVLMVAELQQLLQQGGADFDSLATAELLADLHSEQQQLALAREQQAAESAARQALQRELAQETLRLESFFQELETLAARLSGYEFQLESLRETLQQSQHQHQQALSALADVRAESEQIWQAQSEQIEVLEGQLQQQQLHAEEQIENLNQIIESLARESESSEQLQELVVRSQRTQLESEQRIATLQLEIEALKADNRQMQHEIQALPTRSLQFQITQEQNVIRYQSVLELISLLAPDLPDFEQAKKRLGEALQVPRLRQESAELRLHSGLGRLNYLLAACYPQYFAVPEPEQNRVIVQAGIYPIGDARQSAESPEHTQKTEGFLIDMFPVTNAEFMSFIREGGYQTPEYWTPDGWRWREREQIMLPAYWSQSGYCSGEDFPDYPVVGVSWYEAMAYARWKGQRLPSEIEWEMAARGVEGLTWPWGNEWREGCANTAETGLLNLCPTGSFPAGKSPVGCFDMIGQTYEWSASLYQPYPYDRDDGREDPLSTGPRTLRGCAWSARGSYFTRAAYRFLQPPEHRHSDIGFRCVQDLQPPSPEFDARVESADEVPDFQPVDFELMMKEQLFSSAAANFDVDSEFPEDPAD